MLSVLIVPFSLDDKVLKTNSLNVNPKPPQAPIHFLANAGSVQRENFFSFWCEGHIPAQFSPGVSGVLHTRVLPGAHMHTNKHTHKKAHVHKYTHNLIRNYTVHFSLYI